MSSFHSFLFLLFSFSRITSSFFLLHVFLSLIMPFVYGHSSLVSSFPSFYLSSRHFIFIAWFHLLFHRPFYSFSLSFPFHFITFFLFFLFLLQPSIHSLILSFLSLFIFIYSSILPFFNTFFPFISIMFSSRFYLHTSVLCFLFLTSFILFPRGSVVG